MHTKLTLDNICTNRYNDSEGQKNSYTHSILQYIAEIYTDMTHIWHHPSYYRRLADIKREEERKIENLSEKKNKPLTSKSKSDIVIKHKRNTSAIA